MGPGIPVDPNRLRNVAAARTPRLGVWLNSAVRRDGGQGAADSGRLFRYWGLYLGDRQRSSRVLGVRSRTWPLFQCAPSSSEYAARTRRRSEPPRAERLSSQTARSGICSTMFDMVTVVIRRCSHDDGCDAGLGLPAPAVVDVADRWYAAAISRACWRMAYSAPRCRGPRGATR